MSFFGLETPPAWAFNWCYYFAAMAALAFLNGLTAIFYSKNLGLLLTVLFMILMLIQTATFLTLFWMCRSSLRPAIGSF